MTEDQYPLDIMPFGFGIIEEIPEATLKEKLLVAYNKGATQTALSEKFGISRTKIRSLLGDNLRQVKIMKPPKVRLSVKTKGNVRMYDPNQIIYKLLDELYEIIPDFKTRKGVSQATKNCVRYFIRNELHFTYQMISDYESQRYGIETNHATIINSVKRTENLSREFVYSAILIQLKEILRHAIDKYGGDLLAFYSSTAGDSGEDAESSRDPLVSRIINGKQPSKLAWAPEGMVDRVMRRHNKPRDQQENTGD
jgi:hypothetical protein